MASVAPPATSASAAASISEEQQSKEPPPSRSILPPDAYRFAGLGLQFAATILILGLAGNWADRRFGTRPWLTLAGILLGFVGGTVSMASQIERASRPAGTDAERKGDGPDRPTDA